MTGLYWKAVAAILVAAVLGQTISRQKDLSFVLYMTVCCMSAGIALNILAPVLDFFRELEETGGLRSDTLVILLKALGIGFASQIAVAVCADSGSGALAKSIQLLSTAVILSLSMPLYTSLLELIQDILIGL